MIFRTNLLKLALLFLSFVIVNFSVINLVNFIFDLDWGMWNGAELFVVLALALLYRRVTISASEKTIELKGVISWRGSKNVYVFEDVGIDFKEGILGRIAFIRRSDNRVIDILPNFLYGDDIKLIRKVMVDDLAK